MDKERLRKLDEVLESIERNNKDLKALKEVLSKALEETREMNRKHNELYDD